MANYNREILHLEGKQILLFVDLKGRWKMIPESNGSS